jgi:hypothetical protein
LADRFFFVVKKAQPYDAVFARMAAISSRLGP